MDAQSLYKQLSGRSATPAQIQRLLATAAAMGINSTEAAFLQLIVQEINYGMLHQLPERMESTIQKLAGEAANIAEEKVHQGFNRIVESSSIKISETVSNRMTAEISKISKDYSQKLLDKYKVAFVAAAVVAITVCLSAAAWTGYQIGVERGETLAYERTKDEKSAFVWSSSKNALAAKVLDEKGDLVQILNCSKPGWVKKNNVCYGMPDKNNDTWGWAVK